MRYRRALRRIRRFDIINDWPGILRKLRWTKIQEKHVKIDDEETQYIGHRPSTPRTLMSLIIKFIFFFLGLLFLATCMAYIIYKPPVVLIEYLQRRHPEVVFHLPLPSSQKYVAITVDDAPSSETAKILDLLNIYKAKATFFVIGKQISNYPGVLERIQNEGHEIGIHGWADEPSYKLPLAELELQIRKIETMLPQDPDRVKWFRPGSGWFTKSMIEMLKTIEYKLALGSVYPHDPQIKNPRINAAHVLSMITPGAVIIMHDRRSYSYRQMEIVLQGLAANGWKALSLGNLQKMKMNITTKGFT
ncbi:Peptidoglycan-N-acetylmuramic acid deacetylase PdaC [Erysiphe necator]|nr:Peptidoglycan-N-acetylmuramic acid deacetylase PdaC [Erysiphe necator]